MNESDLSIDGAGVNMNESIDLSISSALSAHSCLCEKLGNRYLNLYHDSIVADK